MKKVLAKKNNKGFSLVELIVVILIMAIIAVALAPQVMKWVGESKDSTDENNMATIKSAVSAGVADYMATGKQITADAYFYVRKDGLSTSNNSGGKKVASGEDLDDKILAVMNGDFPKVQNTPSGSAVFKITVKEKTGAVTVERAAGTYE